MKKRFVLIGTIFFLSLFLVLFVNRKQRGPAPLPLSPTLAPPAPTGIFVQPPNVSFSFSSPPSIPASLPTYTYRKASLPSIEALASRAASQMGMPATPSSLIRGDSYTKTWERPGEAAVTVTKTGEDVVITFRQAKSTGSPAAASPAAAAEKFLSLFFPPQERLSFRPAGITAGSFDGLLVLDEPPPASVSNHYFSLMTDSYPVLTPVFSIVHASVVVDNRGVVRFAHIAAPPQLLEEDQPVSLLNTDQVLASLAAGRGTLLDTHNPQVPDQGEVPKFSSFVIEENRLVYAPKNGRLFPALYVTGTGSSSDLSVQKATIFLWMTPEGAF